MIDKPTLGGASVSARVQRLKAEQQHGAESGLEIFVKPLENAREEESFLEKINDGAILGGLRLC